ncbi:MAG TPA: sugar ABC transporter ATP-binding protein [Solirubrobacteraceae bacterium]|nr:sugar ABC transporter ATP-binding protein [Solirubrobacteraceae bacterium]
MPTNTREALNVSHVAKAFGPTLALVDASLDVCGGEVHALLGENGSGKSTLVKVLAGVHSCDAGSITYLGHRAAAPRTPAQAQQRGVVAVFQEVLVAEAHSVLDNCWIGADSLYRASISRRAKRERASALLERLVGRAVPMDAPIDDLSLSERQACAIVRALLRSPTLLLLDEATSALDFATRDRLFDLVRELCSTGTAVIFITHRLDEIDAIADRLTVLRSGRTVETLAKGEWNSGELVSLMTGAERLTAEATSTPRPVPDSSHPVLSVEGLQLQPGSPEINISIAAGELVGVAGLEGHGQDGFLHALRGAPRYEGTVIRHEGDQRVELTSTAGAAQHGVAYVPRERRQAIFPWMSIRENFGLPTLKRDSGRGWLRPSRTSERLRDYIDLLHIALNRDEDQITVLSGGNQQKVVLARWLAAEPAVLLLNDPTRGIDISAKRDLYTLLTRLAGEGLAIVMLSTELDEHVELMDRVLVFRDQTLSAEIPRARLSRTGLVAAFFGEELDPAEVKP